MEQPKRKRLPPYLKAPLLAVAFGVLLYELLEHWSEAIAALSGVLRILTPIFVGFSIAFIVNLPMRALEKLCQFKHFRLKHRRALCMSVSYIIILSAVAGIVFLVFTRLAQSVLALASNFDAYYRSVANWLSGFWSSVNLPQDILEHVESGLEVASTWVETTAANLVPLALSLCMRLTSGIFGAVISLILSVLLLYNKERLIRQASSFLHACLPAERASRLMRIGSMINITFQKFIVGQFTEALILGGLAFVGMSALNMPYALLIGFILAITSLVPVIGPFAGTIPSALIILLEDPMMAVWFVVFVIVLQQVETNIIYPRVVGNAIGLSALWVLIAVILGGGFFGITGVLLGVPLMSVIYRLVADWTRGRTERVAKAHALELLHEENPG